MGPEAALQQHWSLLIHAVGVKLTICSTGMADFYAGSLMGSADMNESQIHPNMAEFMILCTCLYSVYDVYINLISTSDCLAKSVPSVLSASPQQVKSGDPAFAAHISTV